MGRRTNYAYPAAFVLFVLGLYVLTFGWIDADEPPRRVATAADKPGGQRDWRDDGTARFVDLEPPTRPPEIVPDTVVDVAAPPHSAAGAPAAAVDAVPAYDRRIGVLMIACNRPDVRRALDTLFRCAHGRGLRPPPWDASLTRGQS